MELAGEWDGDRGNKSESVRLCLWVCSPLLISDNPSGLRVQGESVRIGV